MTSIDSRIIVDTFPSVVSTGGNGLIMNGMTLTKNARTPVNTVLKFPTAKTVGAYFGLSSQEYALAQTYFSGYNNSKRKPGTMMFYRYVDTACSAFLRGGNIGSIPLSIVKSYTGDLSVVVDGHTFSATGITLSSATSFSDIAATLATDLNANKDTGSTAITVTFDSLSGGLVIASGTTGAGNSPSTVTYANGTIASLLKLTSATGAVLSQGADTTDPETAMTNVISQTMNWATFYTTWESVGDEALAFAAWTTSQGRRFMYVHWSTDAQNVVVGSTTYFAYLVGLNGTNSNGVFPVYAPNTQAQIGAFVAGAVASIDFTATNGRITLAFKSSGNLTADVTDSFAAAALIANGVNYYGIYAESNDQFVFLYPGVITGDYSFADTLVNEIWLTNAIRLSCMVGLTQNGSVPYNTSGYSLIRSWISDPAQQGLKFGAIVPGVVLSQSQVSELAQQAGFDISTSIINDGFYLQILPALAQVRGLRQTPPINFWYSDGESVQMLDIGVVTVR